MEKKELGELSWMERVVTVPRASKAQGKRLGLFHWALGSHWVLEPRNNYSKIYKPVKVIDGSCG